MDKEVLDTIKARLLEIKTIIEAAADELDVDTIESQEMGKTIAVDFDDADLTNVQVSVDDAASRLQDLSAEIAEYL